MAKAVEAVSEVPVYLYTKHPVTARGTVNTHFADGPKYALDMAPQGVMVTFLSYGSTPEVKVLVPWSNVANVTLGTITPE